MVHGTYAGRTSLHVVDGPTALGLQSTVDVDVAALDCRTCLMGACSAVGRR